MRSNESSEDYLETILILGNKSSGSTGCSYDAPHYKNVIKSIIAYIRHR